MLLIQNKTKNIKYMGFEILKLKINKLGLKLSVKKVIFFIIDIENLLD